MLLTESLPARQGLTAEQIADSVGISVRAVRKKKGLDRFVIGHITGTVGRSAAVYDPKALHLWPQFQAPEEQAAQRARKGRSDVGLPRNCSTELWLAIVARVKGLYMMNAQKNLRLACEEAAKQLTAEGRTISIDVYKRLSRKHTDHEGRYISEYRREGWEIVHDNQWRKKDFAIALPTLRYDYLSIFESAGWAGEGFGALRVWTIDVRKNDVWTENDGGFDADRRYLMPAGVYIRDGLTGFPLWMEPISSSSESQADIIRAYISCGLAWGRFPDVAVAIDNGRAMIAPRTKGVLAASLPPEAWERAAQHPAIFGRDANSSPILQNLPNIPQSMFKAALERSFRQLKDEHDATRHAKHYQGGDRKEGVQLTLAAMPVFPQQMLQAGDYYRGLAAWMWGDYIERERPDQFHLFRERGWSCSIGNVHAYYGGTPQRDGQLPDGERLARILYFATEKPHVVKAQLGHVDATIDGQYGRWICPELHAFFGRKIAVIPIPGQERERAVLMLVDDKKNPQFIGYGVNGFVRSIDQIAPAKDARNAAMQQIRTAVRNEAQSVQDARWYDHNATPALPTTPDRNAGELYIEEAQIVPDDIDDTDFDELMNEVDTLL